MKTHPVAKITGRIVITIPYCLFVGIGGFFMGMYSGFKSLWFEDEEYQRTRDYVAKNRHKIQRPSTNN